MFAKNLVGFFFKEEAVAQARAKNRTRVYRKPDNQTNTLSITEPTITRFYEFYESWTNIDRTNGVRLKKTATKILTKVSYKTSELIRLAL